MQMDPKLYEDKSWNHKTITNPSAEQMDMQYIESFPEDVPRWVGCEN